MRILMADHDSGYKQLFSHPELVRDLLQGFVHEAWVRELDFATLERVAGSYVSDDLRERIDDMVWRVRLRGRWVYVYLLLEFQSTVDPFMAVRLLTYLGLLYQDLLKGGGLKSGDRLPPVLPLVLYNGRPRWSAPLEIGELIEPVPGGLEAYRPAFRHLVLEERRYAEAELAPLKNLAAALFRLENSRSPAEVLQVVRALRGWLGAPEQTRLRRSFAIWIGRVLLVSRSQGAIEFLDPNDLPEVERMLAEETDDWTLSWRRQGLEEGRAEGRAEGREMGLAEGLAEGQRKGERTLLSRLLALRFGPLPEWAGDRLEEASQEALERWGERILDAQTLEQVFAEED
ncbi:Rpn family recombination-promoting nuclease/putative transposase [Endothiovibrio diazotrophicus]